MSNKPMTLIIGAASGLGRALLDELILKGNDKFLLVDLNKTELENIVRNKAEIDISIMSFDVSDELSWEALREYNIKDFYYSVGVVYIGEAGEAPIKFWKKSIDINLNGAIYGLSSCIESIKKNSGSITLISSRASISSAPTMGPYNITKAALVSLAETLYNEVADKNVSVVVACPSYFQSNLHSNLNTCTNKQRKIAEDLEPIQKLQLV